MNISAKITKLCFLVLVLFAVDSSGVLIGAHAETLKLSKQPVYRLAYHHELLSSSPSDISLETASDYKSGEKAEIKVKNSGKVDYFYNPCQFSFYAAGGRQIRAPGQSEKCDEVATKIMPGETKVIFEWNLNLDPGSYKIQSVFTTDAPMLGSIFVASKEIVVKSSFPGPAVHLPILTYHHINSVPSWDPNNAGLYVRPEVLDAQITALKNAGYSIISLSEARQIIQSATQDTDTKNVVLTFDDSYGDFYGNAWPIIKKQNVPATVYVISGKLGDNLDMSQIDYYMTRQQVIELSKSTLINIGSHTVNHTALAGASATRQYDEVSGSKSALEALIGKPVQDFCYPYGSFNSSAINAINAAGLYSATSTLGGTYQSKHWMYQLRRVKIGNGTNILSAVG